MRAVSSPRWIRAATAWSSSSRKQARDILHGTARPLPVVGGTNATHRDQIVRASAMTGRAAFDAFGAADRHCANAARWQCDRGVRFPAL